MRAVLLLLPALGCGPVLLGDEVQRDAGPNRDAGEKLVVALSVSHVSCGCVELTASASGGREPYEYHWADGTVAARRKLCGAQASTALSVYALDADGAQSSKAQLGLADAGCPPPPEPPLLCLENGSFEGTPAANIGLVNSFDAVPWSVCTNPSVVNTPDVANDTVKQMVATVPKPTHGTTFLALGENEQVSQKLCEPIAGSETRSFTIDLSRVNIGAGVVPETERVFLEVWGGIAADCSQRELLWASDALDVGWKTHCITIAPRAFMDQLTLRTNADKTQLAPVYLLADQLLPVKSCP